MISGGLASSTKVAVKNEHLVFGQCPDKLYYLIIQQTRTLNVCTLTLVCITDIE